MHFTIQSKKSTGVLTIKQIIFALVLLIVLIGQVSSIPFPPSNLAPGTDRGTYKGDIPGLSDN